MGILKSGILGPFHKKVGSVVGRMHRKQNVISALPTKSTKPATKDQKESQRKIGLLNGFLQEIDVLVKPGFKVYAKKNHSMVNAAVSYNYDHAFVEDDGRIGINYPEIVYSRGHMLTPESPEVESDAGSITFSWLPQNQSAYCQFTDRASFLVYNPAKQMSVILLNATNRYAQGHILEMPVGFIGDTVHCYMNFSLANGKKNGDSMYVGAVVVK